MKSHFDIFDFSLAVFFFSVIAACGLSFSGSFLGVSSNQAALVAVGNVGSPAGNTGSPTTNQGSYQNSTGKAYSTTQTKNYGSTGDSPGSTVSPAAGQGSYQNSTGKAYSTTQTKNYGNTNGPAGNTGSPSGNVGAPQGGQSGSGGVSGSVPNRYGTAADCKQNVVAKGTFLYPTGVDEKTLGIIVDPVFEAKMKKERFTPDLPVTPIYDLIVEVVPIFGACYTDAPEKFSTTPPKILPFKVSIKVDGDTVVGPGSFVLSSRKDEKDGLLYEWKVPGWMDGIAKGDKMEKLITTIQQQKPVKIVVDTIKQSDGTMGREESETSLGLCAPLWGSGGHKFVFERGISAAIDIPTLVSGKAEKVRENGFEKIEPYRKYSTPGIDEHPGTYFSHIVDLVNHDDSLYLYGITSSSDPEKYMEGISFSSSCYTPKEDNSGNTHNYILYANAKVLLKGASVSGIASPKNRNAVVGSNVGFDTVMHEVGHFFADLRDEDDGYGIPSFETAELVKNAASKNCSFEPLIDFTFGEKLYADKPSGSTKGCSKSAGIINLPPDDPLMQAYRAGKEVTTNSNTPHTPIYRPSPSSLMNYGKNRPLKHNVVSCGWDVAQIKQHGTGPEYFQECLGLDTVKPSGVAVAPPFSNLLAAASNALTVAQSSSQAESGRLNGVIFERDTSLGNVPPAGVVWYSGEPMPSDLKFLLPASSGSSTPMISQSDPYQGHAASSGQTAIESPTVETTIPTQPKPSLWRRFLSYFSWGGDSTY
ncbi:MAG: hypothetical protein Q7S86_01015 [bacterium]|nr:hypothetical protein [bacterium]